MSSERARVFSAIERHDESPSPYEETTFAFLDRAKGDLWERARDTIETWAAHLPDEAFADVRGRLRASDDHSFRSAFFELWLHESLRRSGYAIEIHPELPHSPRKPDFLASRDGSSLYLEAVMRGPARREAAQAARRARFIDPINRIDAGDRWLTLDRLDVGTSAVSTKGLRSQLTKWLESLGDGEQVMHEQPKFRWSEEDWRVKFGVFPRAAGGDDERAIGIYADSPAEFIDDAGKIRDTLRVKTGEYGRLDAPFIIAGGVYLFDEEREDVDVALFGHRTYSSSGAVIERGGGFFGTQSQPERTDVAGVLVVNQLVPYNLDYAKATFARHPWIEDTLPTPAPFPAHEARMSGGEVQFDEPLEAATAFFGFAD